LCEFDYLDNKRDGFPPLRDTPGACAQGFSVLRIDTSLNNWFLSNDIIALGDVLNGFSAGFNHVVGLCFSMGIMPALMFSHQLRLQKIMAFSPVVSIFGDDIPDNRFKTFRKFIQNMDARNMWKDGNKSISGTLGFDPTTHPIDRMQARLIHDHYPNLNPLAMPHGGHPCVRVVKDVDGFEPFQNLVINNKFEPRFLRALHREYREKFVHAESAEKSQRL
jgi:hypothetical protein